MGISDDIVPRHRHGEHFNPTEQAKRPLILRPETSKAVDIVKEPETEMQSSSLEEEDFFAEKPRSETRKPKKPTPKPSDNRVWKWIFALLVLSVIGFVVFSNFKSIKGLFTKDDDAKNTYQSEDKTATTVDEIKPQDYTSGTTETEASQQTATNTTPSQTAAETDTTALKNALKIQVLNGNGIANSASEVKQTLVSNGFKVSSTGNAKTFSYNNTVVYYKTGKDACATLIKNALTTRTVTLEKDDKVAATYDIVLVVGKK